MAHLEHPATDHGSIVDAATQLIDVREPDEFAAGSLPAAVNIPLERLLGDPGQLDRGRRVVLLCRSGRRSGVAAEALVAAGYPDVVNLTGGMLAIEDQGAGS